MFMYAHDWTLKSFPVSAALTYIFRGVYALTRRCRNTKGEPMVPFYQRLFEPTYLLLIYHIATLTTSLRVVLRDYSSSPKTNLNVYQGLTCNTRYPAPFCLYTPFFFILQPPCPTNYAQTSSCFDNNSQFEYMRFYYQSLNETF